MAEAMPPVLKRALRTVVYRQYIHAFWSKDGSNWGDALSPIMIELLSGRKARFTSDPAVDKYMVVGSILHLADERTIVWGAGFIGNGQSMRGIPKQVCAVRGPLSRNELLRCGVEAPEVYGDPALLLPRFYNPKMENRYEVGVVPHYADKHHPWIQTIRNDPKISVIDVECGTYEFVRAIKSCDLIVSSSLHGLICADAYGIPCIWAEFSDQVIGKGFKFYDYFASVKREVAGPIRLTDQVTLAQVANSYRPYRIQIDFEQLILACPFLGKLK